ncbi:hypothetical protein Gotur_007261 [Gossypium turneri]
MRSVIERYNRTKEEHHHQMNPASEVKLCFEMRTIIKKKDEQKKDLTLLCSSSSEAEEKERTIQSKVVQTNNGKLHRGSTFHIVKDLRQ